MSALQDCIRHVVSHQHLSLSQARDALGAILDGRATGAQIGAFLTALRMKGETAEEIAGLALAAIGVLMVQFEWPTSRRPKAGHG